MAARPVPTKPIPERVVLVGCAGSGKTTLARALAARLDARHIERDALGDDETPGFATRVAAAVQAAGRRWVFDGAPYNAEPLVYPHADTVIALDYPIRVVLRRVLTRSARTWLTGRTDGAHTTSPPWRWWAPTHPVRWATQTHAARHAEYGPSLPTPVGCGSPRHARPPHGWPAFTADCRAANRAAPSAVSIAASSGDRGTVQQQGPWTANHGSARSVVESRPAS
jgi:energy-coupling factor transporter ATP-binding protein EcfA2